MKWYVSNAGVTVGPIDAADVQRGIAEGKIERGMHVRDEAGTWTPIEQSPFASLLTKQAVAAQVAVPKQQASGGAALGFAALIITVFGGFMFFHSCGSSRSVPVASRPLPPAVKAQPAKREPTIAEQLKATTDLSVAISLLRPSMEDTNGGELSASAAALALWSSEKMRWAALDAMPDSRRADVMKDPDAFRGKRICTSGSVIEIQADRSVSPPIYQGGLMTSSFDMVRFAAVQSTEGINAQSVARICGIITGLQSYPNSAGGTTHAVYVVGMFDLPENKTSGGGAVKLDSL